MQELKIFEEKQIRTIWDEVQEKWYFCINDVIAALTDSKDPAEYFKKIRRLAIRVLWYTQLSLSYKIFLNAIFSI